MNKFKLFGLVALALQFAPVAAGQEGLPGTRRGDPTSPGGRPLADTGTWEQELRHIYDQLLKELADLRAKNEQLNKEAADVRAVGLKLLDLVKASGTRLEAARAGVELGRPLGGVSERARSELEAAERERRGLRDAVGKWERFNNAVNGAKRELSDNASKLRQRADAFMGSVTEAKRGAPDSFGEIEKRARELNEALNKK